MVGRNTPGLGKTTTGQVGDKPKLSPTDQLRLDRQDEILKQLGVGDPSGLSENARLALEQALAGDLGALKRLDGKKVAGELKQAFAEDFGRQFAASFEGPDSFRLPTGTAQLTKAAADGKGFQLVGTAASKGSPVVAALEELKASGLNVGPEKFGPRVKDAIESFRGQDLGNEKVAAEFAQKLASAAVLDTPTSKIGATFGVSGPGATEKTSGVDAVSAKGDLGLAKTARTEDAKKIDGTKTPDAIMNSEAVRDPTATDRRAAAVKGVLDGLVDAGLPVEQATALAGTLEHVLKDGQLGAKTATDKSWAILRAAEKQRTGQAMPKDKGKLADDPLYRDATSLAASFHIFNLAEEKSGAKLDWTKVEGVQAVIEGYTKSEAAGAKSKSKSASAFSDLKLGAREGAEEVAAKKTRGPKVPEHKEMAHEYARQLGLDPNDPITAHTVRDIESAFAQIFQGAKSDADVTKRALAWVDRKTEGGTAGLAKHLETVLDSAPKDSEMHATVKAFALQKVAHCAAVGPAAYTQHLQGMVGAGGPMMGGPMGPGGMMPGGIQAPYGMMEQAISSNFRCMQTAMILNDPALSHEDKIILFLMMMSTYQDQDRIRKMREIADVDAKSVMQKQAHDAQTTVNAQGSAAARQQAQTGTEGPKNGSATVSNAPKAETGTSNAATETAVSNAPTAQTGTSNASAETATAAQAAAASPPPKNPPKTNTAGGGGPPPPPDGPPKNDGPTPPGGPNPPAGQVAPQDIVAGQQAAAAMNPEGPKSKEMLFSELERINKLRDMLFEMVNSFMRQHNQRMKEMWR